MKGFVWFVVAGGLALLAALMWFGCAVDESGLAPLDGGTVDSGPRDA